jgi:tetratricopeptide (TPR) repeat protein
MTFQETSPPRRVLSPMLRPLLLLALAALPAFAADDATREQVNRLFQERRWSEAQAIMERVTTAEPDNAGAWHTLGLCHLALQEPDQAVTALERAVALAPQEARNHLQLGHAYGLSALKAGLFGKFSYAKKCKAAYDKAVELDPADLNARWSLMEYCRQAPGLVGGGMDQAYAQAEAIRKLDARRGRAAYAALYAHEKKFPEAFALYDEVLREQPEDADALFNVGRLAVQSGEQLDRGLASLRRLAAQPDRKTDARVHTFIGNILEKLGDKDGARTAYEAALVGDPKFTRALEALRKLQEG